MAMTNPACTPKFALRPKRIGIVGFDDVTALHLIAPSDAFGAAALDDGYGGLIPCYQVCTIGVTSDRLRTENGLRLETHTTLAHAPELDTIIIAGGRGILQSEVIDRLAKWILQRIPETRRFCAVSSGVYGLAAAGLLNDRQVTTHWRVASDLAKKYPRLKIDHRKPFVHDGPYYTSTGLNGGANVALAVIREDYGPYLAQSVEQELALRLTKEDQEEIPPDPAAVDNHPIDRFSDLVAWVIRNLHADLSVEVLARRACMCPDHFRKVFKSVFGEPPGDFVQNLRLNEARRRLAKRKKTVHTVAASVGFSNPEAFHRAFERKFGTRPNDYVANGPSFPIESVPENIPVLIRAA